MNRSMKQMLSALLVVAMLAAMMVVPGIAANDAGSDTYKVTADAATVKVDETTTVNAKLVYGVNNDTYALTADTVYTVAGDAKVAVTAYALSGDTVAITVKGVEAGEGKVTVTINGVTGEVKVTVTAKTEPSKEPEPSEEPGPGPIVTDADYVLDIGEEVAAGRLEKVTYGKSDPAEKVSNLGTEGRFTLITKFSGNSAIQDKRNGSVEFEDGYAGQWNFKTGGGASVMGKLESEGKCIAFTTEKKSTVKVWLYSASGDGGALNLANQQGDAEPVEFYTGVAANQNVAQLVTITDVPAGTNYLYSGASACFLRVEVTLDKDGDQPGTDTVDTKALTAAIADAYTLANDTYTIKADTVTAASVTKGEKFVNQKDVDALNAAIAAAEAVAAKADATQAEVDAALVDLAAAVDAFNAAVKTGTKGDSGSIVVPPAASNNARPVTTTTNKTDANGNNANKTTDRNGNVTITVTDKDGEVVAKVEIPAVIPALATKFKDVPEGHWAEKSINTLAALGMVKGVADETYDMVSPVTRGSLATILFRLAQATGAASDFSDVAADAWYADAVGWAAKVGIITGKGDGTFSADESITREQLAVMLYRFAGLLGVDTKLAGELADFTDGEATSDWATEAMTWAVGAGILQGNTDKELNPTGAASRAETACMVDRFIGLVK